MQLTHVVEVERFVKLLDDADPELYHVRSNCSKLSCLLEMVRIKLMINCNHKAS